LSDVSLANSVNGAKPRLRAVDTVAPNDVIDVSVTIVAYECRDLILECIATLNAGAPCSRLEIIVADNGSHDGVIEALNHEYPDVRTLEIGANIGFGRAHNAAAGIAKGRYLLVLNPDTVVRAGSIDRLVEFADAAAAKGAPIGLLGPLLLNPDGSDQRTARSFPTFSAGVFGRRSPLTRWFPNNPWSKRFLSSVDHEGDAPWRVDWVSGAAMLIPRDFFQELGGFDPDFFMHFEDAELCHRIAARGRDVWCVPAAEIVHDEGGTRDRFSVSQLWHFHHGAYLFVSKARYSRAFDPRRWAVAILLAGRFGFLVALNRVATRLRETKSGINSH
jgi:GT2 family glycosyltransferase